jgi:hypothetical protein
MHCIEDSVNFSLGSVSLLQGFRGIPTSKSLLKLWLQLVVEFDKGGFEKEVTSHGGGSLGWPGFPGPVRILILLGQVIWSQRPLNR